MPWWFDVQLDQKNLGRTLGGVLKNIEKSAYVLYGRPQNFWQEKPIFSPSFLVPFTAEKDINNRKPNQTVSFFCKVQTL